MAEQALEYFFNGYTAAENENSKVDYRKEIQQMSQEDAKTITLQQSDR